MLEAGITGRAEAEVTQEVTAKAMGSGELDVLATPALAALVEKAAWTSVAAGLEEGQGTVGTRLELDHLAPTPVGMRVSCETRLVEVDGRRLVFEATASDKRGEVGRARHERFVIASERFQAKADAKLEG